MLEGLLSLGGDIAGGMMAGSAQAGANQANKEIAKENRDWQEWMSNTAYQRSRKDMEAAGLNPIMAANAGGASTPSGSTATMQAETAMGEALQKSSSSAFQTMNLRKDLKQKDANIALTEASKETEKAKLSLTEANVLNTLTNINKTKNENIKSNAHLPAELKEAANRSRQADIDRAMQKFDNTLSRTRQGLGLVNDAASVLKPKISIGRGGPTDYSGRSRAEVERDNYKKQLNSYRKGRK